MLRKIVKSLIPSQDKIFFELLIEATNVVVKSGTLLDKIMKEDDKLTKAELSDELRMTRAVTVEIANKIDHELARSFITPIDRAEIHNITTELLKLNKRIVKIHRYVQILLSDESTSIDLRITNCIETLKKMTRIVNNMMKAFSNSEFKELKSLYIRLSALDEDVLEDLGRALDTFSKSNLDEVMLIIKVKDIYKSLENAVSGCTTVAETIMRVHVKEI